MYFSNYIASLALYFLLSWTNLNVQAGSSNVLPSRRVISHDLQSRDTDETPVNLTGIPQCAAATCLNGTALTPAELGCDGTTLTKTCFCETAVTPLSCAPHGPSGKDHCFDNMENWFAGICGQDASQLQLNGLPTCAQSCVSEYILKMGCQALTRNCFCELNGDILNSSVSCCVTSNCPVDMVGGFSANIWRDLTCQYGSTPNFDYGQWNAYKARSKRDQIGGSIPLCLLGLVCFWGSAVNIKNNQHWAAFWIMVAWCIFALPILISLYLPDGAGDCEFPF